jgi:hypothetical protein
MLLRGKTSISSEPHALSSSSRQQQRPPPAKHPFLSCGRLWGLAVVRLYGSRRPELSRRALFVPSSLTRRRRRIRVQTRASHRPGRLLELRLRRATQHLIEQHRLRPIRRTLLRLHRDTKRCDTPNLAANSACDNPATSRCPDVGCRESRPALGSGAWSCISVEACWTARCGRRSTTT